MALPLERRDGERQRDAPALLLGVVVADRGAVLDPPEPVDGAGAVQERLGQRRLAGAAVADQGHVADLLGRKELHSVPPRWSTAASAGQGSQGPYAALVVAPSTLRLPDGRTLAYDDVGDPDGAAGRLPPRHARLPPRPPARRRRRAAAGRAAARRRPARASGDSDLAPGGRRWPSLGRRPRARCSTTSGSSAAILLGLVGRRAGRARRRPRVARRAGRRRSGSSRTLPPVEAYDDADAGRGPRRPGGAPSPSWPRRCRRASWPPRWRPYLVPDPLDADGRARARARAGGRASAARELAQVPGAVEALAAGLRGERASRAARGWPATSSASSSRASTSSTVDGPGAHLPRRARTRSRRPRWAPGSSPGCPTPCSTCHPDAGHHLLFPRWRGILRALRRDAGI